MRGGSFMGRSSATSSYSGGSSSRLGGLSPWPGSATPATLSKKDFLRTVVTGVVGLWASSGPSSTGISMAAFLRRAAGSGSARAGLRGRSSGSG